MSANMSEGCCGSVFPVAEVVEEVLKISEEIEHRPTDGSECVMSPRRTVVARLV